MGKLVTLKLEGDFEQGFWVTLEIGLEGALPSTETTGKLPPATELVTHYSNWQSAYRALGISARGIKPQKIIYDGSIQTLREECRHSAFELGECINRWLRSESFHRIREKWLEKLSPDDEVRVLIRTENLQLRQLPWYCWDLLELYPLAEVALSALDIESPPQKPIPRHKVRILAILGNSEGIDVEKDRQLLENLPDAETTFLVEPQRQKLNDLLGDQPWDILFFAGHSQTEGDKGRIYINQTDSLTIDEVRFALIRAVERGLQLAIFNSCEGLGLARELEQLHIRQVIVMREPVPDRVAQEFLKYFLKEFVGGAPLYLAVQEARKKLQGLGDEFPCAYWLPVICQNPVVEPPTWHQLMGIDSHRPQISLIAIVSVVITILAMGMRQLRIRQEWELQAYDQLSRQQSAEGLDPRLLRDTGQSIKFGLTGLLLLGLGFGSWQLASPRIAIALNNRGFDNYLTTRVLQAQKNFELAVQFNPDNAAVYYNQGWHCEDARDFDCAREKYRRAALLGMAAAHSNLARLSILLDKDYDAAANLSQQGLRLAKDDRVKYALLKNLGWARLGQRRYREANVHLQSAIALGGNSATAHCLLAQVLEAQSDLKGAQRQWETCRQSADVQNPDEDVWMGMAQQRLEAEGEEQ